jgi:hypothetical protein
MGIDWTALANTVSGIGQGLSQPNSTTQNLNLKMNQMFQAQAQQQALQRAEEERKKKEKSGFLGKVGSALGTIGGIALAPVTGGTSLAIPAALGAAGGAIGGSVGRAVGGGGFDMQQTLTDAAMGGVGGLGAGVLGGFGKVASEGANVAAKVMPGPIGNIMSQTNKLATAATPMSMAKGAVSSMINPIAAISGRSVFDKKPRLIPLGDGTFYFDDGTGNTSGFGY